MYDNRKKIILLLILITFIFSLFTVYIYSESAPRTSARAAALYEPQTGRFIYTKNENERLGMASTTKIMTALLAIEGLDLNETVAVDERACGIEGSSIYLKPGELLSAIDLVYSVILASANDAAAALAYKIAGSIEAFSEMMNERADSFGLTDTNFTNPHGLDGKEHYTTAHDLAIISARALENDTFREITSTYRRTVESSEQARVLVNHNKMLKMYDGCIGVKTGYTKRCGRCLVSAAERENLRLVCVTIDAPDDWRDHTEMLDYGYSLIEAKTLAKEGEFSYKVPVIGGTQEYVDVSNTDEVRMIFNKGEGNFETYVKLSRYLVAPINEGDILGKVIFTLDGKEIASIDLVSESGVQKIRKKFFSFK